MTRIVHHQLSISAPLAEVWTLWTDAKEVIKWFAPVANVEPVVGGKYELFFMPSNLPNKNTSGCHIVHMIPEQELTFTWKGPNQFTELMNTPRPQTLVTVRFKQNPNGSTCVKLFHRGFQEDSSWDYAYDWHELAWAGILNQLQTHVEKSTDYLLGYTPNVETKLTVSCAG